MKKILIPILLLSCFFSKAQNPFNGNAANAALLIRFTDTTGIVPKVSDSIAAIILRKADSTFYIYTKPNPKWTKFAGAGTTYTFQNSLTSSGGNVNLVNDATSPGNKTFYGVNGSGTKKWLFHGYGTLMDADTLKVDTATLKNVFGAGSGTSPGGATTNIQFNNAGVFGGSANNTWDNTNFIQKITTPTTATTVYPSFLAQNTATASSGNQMYGGTFASEGQGWKTTATAASQEVGYRMYTKPYQGTTNPGGEFVIQHNINAGTYFEAFKFDGGAASGGATNFQFMNTTANGSGIYFAVGTGTTHNFLTVSTTSVLDLGGITINSNGTHWTVGGSAAWSPAANGTQNLGEATLAWATGNINAITSTGNLVLTAASGSFMVQQNSTAAFGSSVTTTGAKAWTFGYMTNGVSQANGSAIIVDSNNNVLLQSGGGAVQNTSFRGGIALASSNTITAGSSSTIANSIINTYINPASLIATYTITLPSAPIDGAVIQIFGGGTLTGGATVVTSFTISPNSGQSIVQGATGVTTLLAGGCYIYQWNAADNSWYRKQ